MQKLAMVEPEVSTALEVEQTLDSDVAAGSTPAPLWNDLIDYNPPVLAHTTAGTQIAIDNELLRAARADADYKYVLFWAALNLADTRLDRITQSILTDGDGRFNPDKIDRQTLGVELSDSADEDDLPQDGKPVTNILSLLERCGLIEPLKRGGSIIGVEHMLPTRNAAKPLVTLVRERLTHQGISVASDREVDLAIAIGANAWLGLSRDEFLAALETDSIAAVEPSQRNPLPDNLFELASQLRRKRQVVLQGPPGAGKTHIARKYVDWATAGRTEDSRLQSIIDSLPVNERAIDGIAAEIMRRGLTAVWDIVQFHPGYDYTDFVRALVAEPHANGVTFTPRHRLFSLIAGIGLALQEQGRQIELVLILDEINRGNIPNIFGELLYALEYRNEAVCTAYTVDGSASITVPSNLFLIGTMNTADRSIAVIDYALRRRFVFLNVLADDKAIDGYGFDSQTTREGALYLADVTREALADAPAGLKVGASYFLAKPDGPHSSLDVLADRFIYEVLPLLDEYEMEGEVDTAALGTLRKKLDIIVHATQREQANRLADHLLNIRAAGVAMDLEPELQVESTSGDDTTDSPPQ